MQHRSEFPQESSASTTHHPHLVIEDLDGGFVRGDIGIGICWTAVMETGGAPAPGQLSA